MIWKKRSAYTCAEAGGWSGARAPDTGPVAAGRTGMHEIGTKQRQKEPPISGIFAEKEATNGRGTT